MDHVPDGHGQSLREGPADPGDIRPLLGYEGGNVDDPLLPEGRRELFQIRMEKPLRLLDPLEGVGVVGCGILLPFFRKLVRIRSKKLFFGLYVLSSMWRYKSEKPISWPEVIKVFWRARKNYLRYVS